MKVYRNLDTKLNVHNPVVTTGTFDGVHLGHKKIIQSLKDEAAKIGGETVIFTFWPHPRLVLFPDGNDLKLLNTLDEKIALFEKTGLDHLVLFEFTPEFSRLSALEYVRDILVDKLGVKKLVIGYDHRFGKNREGDFSQLKELSELFDFSLKEISALDIDEVNVSSTKIRRALEAGDVSLAKAFLSYPYFINGEVIHGEALGRKLGYPTANLSLKDTFKLIPAKGVYAVKVNVDGTVFNGMLNIGTKPTFKDGKEVFLEVHLDAFSGNLYGKTLRVEFIERLRDEQKFSDTEELKRQLGNDLVAMRTLIA